MHQAISGMRMILTHAEYNSPYLAGSFSLSYRVLSNLKISLSMKIQNL